MSQSTPLNMLRRGDEPPSQSMQMQMPMQASDAGNMMAESQLVEDILKEMGEGPVPNINLILILKLFNMQWIVPKFLLPNIHLHLVCNILLAVWNTLRK